MTILISRHETLLTLVKWISLKTIEKILATNYHFNTSFRHIDKNNNKRSSCLIVPKWSQTVLGNINLKRKQSWVQWVWTRWWLFCGSNSTPRSRPPCLRSWPLTRLISDDVTHTHLILTMVKWVKLTVCVKVSFCRLYDQHVCYCCSVYVFDVKPKGPWLKPNGSLESNVPFHCVPDSLIPNPSFIMFLKKVTGRGFG